jgi:hypothetical protein
MEVAKRILFFAETADIAERYQEGRALSLKEFLELIRSITEEEAKIAINGIARIAKELS